LAGGGKKKKKKCKRRVHKGQDEGKKTAGWPSDVKRGGGQTGTLPLVEAKEAQGKLKQTGGNRAIGLDRGEQRAYGLWGSKKQKSARKQK